MNTINYSDKLKEAVKLCAIHLQNLTYAPNKVASCVPMDEVCCFKLTQDDQSYFGQPIFRFSKLQDTMGEKLFPAIPENLGEDIVEKPFVDRLNMLENLGLLENKNQWIEIRETRNLVTHEYPFYN